MSLLFLASAGCVLAALVISRFGGARARRS
jgi:hypothetical protein